MLVSDLINVLSAIKNDIGDVHVQILCDTDQLESVQSNPIIIDDLKLVKISKDGKFVQLSNEYCYSETYKGCTCIVTYDHEKKKYYGKISTPENIEGFNLRFECDNKYQIKNTFMRGVEEYRDFMSNAKITKTYNKINEIIGEDETDLDYGELSESAEEVYEESEDDDDYGET